MKKTLAIILSLVLIFCMLPINALAAKEMFMKISEVTVNEVSAPAAGTEVQLSANCTTKYVAINSVQWYESATTASAGEVIAKGGKFKPGYYYTVIVQLKISNNAYYFEGNGSSVSATVNGHSAKVVTLNSAQIINVSYTFPMCLATVSKFEFNLAAPTAGAAPHYPLLTGTGYESNNRGNNGAAYKNGIYWRNETDNKVLYPNENPKFEAGKTYSANITVATTTGYRVASSPTVKVNGKTVTSQKVDNECITFKVNFEVPKSHTHSDSSWKTDRVNHWKVCTDSTCGAVTVSQEAHKDTNKDYKCDICGYALPKTETPLVTSTPATITPNSSAPAASTPTTGQPADSKTESATETIGATNDDTLSSDTADTESEPLSSATDTNADQNAEDKEDSDAWIWIIIAIVVLLAAGGVITVIVLKKKKENKK